MRILEPAELRRLPGRSPCCGVWLRMFGLRSETRLGYRRRVGDVVVKVSISPSFVVT